MDIDDYGNDDDEVYDNEGIDFEDNFADNILYNMIGAGAQALGASSKALGQAASLLQQQLVPREQVPPPDLNHCSEKMVELCALLLSLDGQFVKFMREIANDAQTARLLRMILGQIHAGNNNQEPEMSVGFTEQQLRIILPKCDDQQIQQIREFLLKDGIVSDQRIVDGIPLPVQLDLLPLMALEALLAQNTIESVGDEAALSLRREIVDCGLLNILLDLLAHCSKQTHRFGTEQLGFIDFSGGQQQHPIQSKKPRLNVGVKVLRGRGRGARQGRAYTSRGVVRKRHWAEESPSGQSLLEFNSTRRANNQMVEWLLKVFNAFLLCSDRIPIENSMLTPLYRSSLRNTVRSHLMNGNLNEVIECLSIYGALLQFLQTLANSIPVFVENLSSLYEKDNQPNAIGEATGGCVYSFDVVLGEDKNGSGTHVNGDEVTDRAGTSASSAVQPVLGLLSTFAKNIDDYVQHYVKRSDTINTQREEEGESAELLSLSSLSTLCATIISIATEQGGLVQVLSQANETPVDDAPTTTVTSTAKSSSWLGSISSLFYKSEEGPQTNGQCAKAESNEALNAHYQTELKPFHFVIVPFGDQRNVLIPHHFRNKFNTGTSVGMANHRLKRIGIELNTLRTGLPLYAHSSAFVCASDEYMDAFKMLITGPEGTPYENGCFEFDIFLDQNFPNAPPLVNLQTTGNGSVRFNPNLYNSGKVCLSLLGTWPGRSQAEMWSPSSTLLQVITSIQSLILVKDPYYNEPGYESMRNNERGKKASHDYNQNIRVQTVRWAMIESLCHTPRGFEEVVRRHFWLKRNQIEAQVQRWIAEGTPLKAQQTQLQTELKKLEVHFTSGKSNGTAV